MDPDWIATVLSIGVGLGLSAAAGLRVFLPMLLLGVAARLGWISVSGDFQWIASGLALGSFGAATVLEIGAYYVPWLDNILDAAAGPAAVAADLPPAVRWSAAIVAGGGTAGLVQGLTTIARLKSSVLTGGLGNPILATFEWVGALVTAIVVLLVPALALVLVIGLVYGAARVTKRKARSQ